MVDLERGVAIRSSGPTESDSVRRTRTVELITVAQWMSEDPQSVELLESLSKERPGLVGMEC